MTKKNGYARHFPLFLWSLLSPEKILRHVAKILKDSDNRIFVSTTTFWEIALKFSLNKLAWEGITPDALPEFANKIKFGIRAGKQLLFTILIDIDITLPKRLGST